mgnify:CR=1 FL=1
MSGVITHQDGLKRCHWPGTDPLYLHYHDTEWGVPELNDRALFEKLILDGFQAGLSWITILRKRENFRKAFDGFDPTNPKHIRKDNEINERIKTTEWKQNFMWILINEIYPSYIKEGLSEPKEITCETQNYMKDNDKFGEFIRLCTETTESFKRTRIGLLHETYLEYHKTFFGKPGNNLADFIKILGQKGYKVEERGMHNIYVYGIDVKKNDEDDEQAEINE